MLNQACSCGCVGENLKLQGQLGSALREGINYVVN